MSDISYSINEVSTGIYQLKMPLPFRLNHINLYLIEDQDGWVLVDTGLNTETTRELWKIFLNSGFFQKPINKIFLTHLHPDHIGMSAWLSETLNASVYISKGDWDMAQLLWHNDSPAAESLYEVYWKAFGVADSRLQEMVDTRLHYKNLVKELPSSVIFIDPQHSIQINGVDWHFLATPGHSPEHLVLWCPSKKTLISGDHVLPTITPNISCHPYGLTNPLEDYMASLRSLLSLDCSYYLPAHGPISSDLNHRINDLIQHHQEKLEKLMNGIVGSTNVVSAMPLLFSPDLPAHQLMFAYAETAAHLVYLAKRHFLTTDDNNQWCFTHPSSLRSASNRIYVDYELAHEYTHFSLNQL